MMSNGNIQGQESQIKDSLFEFVKTHIPDADLNLIDEIVLSYVVAVLEDVSSDPVFDVEGFCEMMSAYFPEFESINHSTICQWIFDLAAKLQTDQPRTKDISLVELSLPEILPKAKPRSKYVRTEDISKTLLELEEEENVTFQRGQIVEDSDSDLSEECIEYSDHDTESEIECDYESEVECNDESFYLGKDNQTKWYKTAFINSKTRASKMAKKFSRPTKRIRDARIMTELDAFNKFFSTEMIDLIVKYTNLRIEVMNVKYKSEKNCKSTSREEVMAVLGILFLLGTKNGQHTNVEELWNSDGTGMENFCAAMSYRRFVFLMACFRFDDETSREERRKIDKLAPIREIFEAFVTNCKLNYNLSAFVTIDEILHTFNGRCSFIQYIPSKPTTHGVKMFAMCDAKTFYTSNLEVYVGRQPEGPYNVSNSPLEIVKRLVNPIENLSRNLTTDSWYTSIPLGEYLLQKKITLLGTLRKNTREIPSIFLPNKSREEETIIYGFQKEKLLVSYTPKKTKGIILLSTMHNQKEIDKSTGKPLIITDYNKTKIAVSIVDKMSSTYNVARITKRWPMIIFFACLNIGGINAQVIYSYLKPKDALKHRKQFLHTMSLSLMNEQILSKSSIRTLPAVTSPLFKRKYLFEPVAGPALETPVKRKKGRCRDCGRRKNSSSSATCSLCEKFTCKMHSKLVCNSCFSLREDSECSE